ncbi:unnamed protein product [Hyaloperonospora brassicae]|uniref:Senescence domain-containing protein n=1 Tax=Hyaloperonospora brassicae TaxID=162125 RepID=A0AAV0UCZ1_HYABA|nr:unnamed protein product [Hyaloperonospora brassicae]
MDDVSLKQKQTDDDIDLENLIFNHSDPKELEQTTQRRDSDDDDDEEEALDGPETEKPAAMQMQDSDSDESDATTKSMAKGADRSSLNNVLPVDKLKNGATTASKVFGQTFSMFKEKSGAALEAAKSSNAGKTIAGGLSNAATASQEKYGKLKGTDAFKKSSTLASDAYERTSLVASGALEKARAASSSGLEMAKHTAAASIETIKSKTGSKKGGEN